MEKTLDLVGIGECLVEFAERRDGRYERGYAGDVLNALSMASALGLRTGLISAIGTDPFAEGLEQILLADRIDLRCSPIVSDRPNGVYFTQTDKTGKPTFFFLRKDSAATEALLRQPIETLISYVQSARALLFSSIPLAVMKGRDRLLEIVAMKDSTELFFDLNVRPSLWPDLALLKELLPRILRPSSALFVTNDDDRILFGEREVEPALESYHELGARTVVFRRGAERTLVSDGSSCQAVETVRMSEVIDSTGAGDAFNAGFISARLRGLGLVASTQWGNAAAASVLSHRGGRASHVTLETVATLVQHLDTESAPKA